MVAHQRRKHRYRQPPQQKLPAGVPAEPAGIRAAVQKSAHIEGRHVVHVLPQHLPGGGIIAGPDTAVPVCADIRRAREQQIPPVQQLAQTLAGGPGHHRAVQIVNLVVADMPAVVQAVEEVLEVRDIAVRLIRVASVRVRRGVLFPVLGGENRRFIHVVPKALQAQAGVKLIVAAEPGPGLLLHEIREMGHPRPDLRLEVPAVSVLAEIAVLDALLIHRVSRLNFDARVHNRHQMEPPLQHPGCVFGHLREPPAVDRKIDIPVHVVNVQADVI